MKLRKRYILLILLALLPFYKLIHTDDYCFSDVDRLLIGLLTLLFVISFIAIVFYNLYRISLRNELFNGRPIIIAVIFSIALFLGFTYHDKNPFKNKTHVFNSTLKNSTALELVLFSDKTFQFKTTLKDLICVKGGNYFFKKDSLYIKPNHKITEESMLDVIYVVNKAAKTLKPKKSVLPSFTFKR